MIIKEISTQSFDENGERPFLYRDSTKYSPSEWKRMLQYLRRNKKEKLLDFEIVEE